MLCYFQHFYKKKILVIGLQKIFIFRKTFFSFNVFVFSSVDKAMHAAPGMRPNPEEVIYNSQSGIQSNMSITAIIGTTVECVDKWGLNIQAHLFSHLCGTHMLSAIEHIIKNIHTFQ